MTYTEIDPMLINREKVKTGRELTSIDEIAVLTVVNDLICSFEENYPGLEETKNKTYWVGDCFYINDKIQFVTIHDTNYIFDHVYVSIFNRIIVVVDCSIDGKDVFETDKNLLNSKYFSVRI